MTSTLARNWWALVLRGVAALALGVLTIAVPRVTLMLVTTLFAAYALAGGVLSLVAVYRGDVRERGQWWALLLEGVAGVAIAVVAFIWPKTTVVFLVYLVACWAIVTGVLDVVAAVRLRKHLRGEWLLLAAGLASLALGLLVFFSPSLGLRALAVWIGVYAIVFGTLMVLLGLRLRETGLPTQPSGGHAIRP